MKQENDTKSCREASCILAFEIGIDVSQVA